MPHSHSPLEIELQAQVDMLNQQLVLAQQREDLVMQLMDNVATSMSRAQDHIGTLQEQLIRHEQALQHAETEIQTVFTEYGALPDETLPAFVARLYAASRPYAPPPPRVARGTIH